MTPRILRKADDVTDEVLQAAEETSEFFDGAIEWDRFWDLLCGSDFDIEDLDTPATRKIQKHVREFRRPT